MYEDELQQIGLSEKEAKVYMAALELGKASALDIAKKAKIKRPTTYFTIDMLMKQGLMSSVYEGKKQFFMAENPERLEDVFKSRQDELRRQGEKLQKMIPGLRKMQPKGGETPVVRYYTGREGALSMAKDLLSDTGSEVWIVYPADTVASVFTPEERAGIQFTRENKDVKINALYTSEKRTFEDDRNVTRKKINEKEFPVTADIAVYGDKVRLASFGKDVVGVVVENKEIAQTLKQIIRLAWEGADNHLS